jgi:hypothetical protein
LRAAFDVRLPAAARRSRSTEAPHHVRGRRQQGRVGCVRLYRGSRRPQNLVR